MRGFQKEIGREGQEHYWQKSQTILEESIKDVRFCEIKLSAKQTEQAQKSADSINIAKQSADKNKRDCRTWRKRGDCPIQLQVKKIATVTTLERKRLSTMKILGTNESPGYWITLGVLWSVSDVLQLLGMLKHGAISWISLLLIGALAIINYTRGLFLIFKNKPKIKETIENSGPNV